MGTQNWRSIVKDSDSPGYKLETLSRLADKWGPPVRERKEGSRWV